MSVDDALMEWEQRRAEFYDFAADFEQRREFIPPETALRVAAKIETARRELRLSTERLYGWYAELTQGDG